MGMSRGVVASFVFFCIGVTVAITLPHNNDNHLPNADHCFSSFNFTSEKGTLNVNGLPFILKGVSWFGFETSNNVFHGLWARDYKDLLDFLATNGFNALRVPFYLELVLNDAKPDSINFYNMNADLQGLTSLQVLDKVIQAAADRGILIMLDLHSFKGGTFMQDGLWYDAAHPEATVLKGWDTLMQRYGKQWNVVAFDLKNEPWGTTWGGDASTDWHAAAQRIGNHILSTKNGSRMLIFVEGTNNSPACTDNCFWGENLQGALTTPVVLSDPKKLVYSPHCYGPSVAYQPYFQVSNFPNNMPAIWDAHWGTVNTKTGQASVLGEWGGQLGGSDELWLNAFVAYLAKNGHTSQFFWCLNPDSGDTGGLLLDDWKTPVQGKLDLLTKLGTGAKFSVKGSQYCVTLPN